MILVLNGADFSENNIGHVDLNFEIDDFTLEAIEKSGNNSLTDAQKNSLYKFFREIGAPEEGSIYDKMDYIYIPMIAGDVSHAFVDYRGNLDIAVDASKLQLVNHGVTGASSTPYWISAPIGEEKSLRDLTIVSMAMNDGRQITSLDCNYVTLQKDYTSRVMFQTVYNSNYNTIGDRQFANQAVQVDYYTFCNINSPENTFNKLHGFSWLNNQGFFLTDISYLTRTIDTSIVSTYNKFDPLASLGGGGVTNTRTPVGFIAVGKHLTPDELLKFKKAAEQLHDSIVA